LPTTSGEVQEFDVPLLEEVPVGAGTGSAAVPRSSGAGSRPVGDARALFQDNPKSAPRRVGAAEARAQARRCPTCGGVVPAGMSICQTCGLDLETKTRVALDDDLAPPPAPRGPALPLSVGIVGGVCLLASAILTLATLVLWLQGSPGLQYFVPVCLFGVFAAVQFLRLKSVRLLLIALTFGLGIDIIALIAMPIYHANMETAVVARAGPAEGPDQPDVIIESVVNRLDTDRLSLGIGLIVVYAGVSIYLLSPQIQRHFRYRRDAGAAV
jgi:hypothetical protein